AEAWYHLLDRLLVFTDRMASPFPPDLRDPSRRHLVVTDVFVPRTIYREMFSLLARNRRRFHEFRTPLLLALAKHDQLIDNAVAERFYQQCAAPSKRLYRGEEAGHLLPRDFGWEELVDEVARFAEAIATPRSPSPHCHARPSAGSAGPGT